MYESFERRANPFNNLKAPHELRARGCAPDSGSARRNSRHITRSRRAATPTTARMCVLRAFTDAAMLAQR